ncbi:medium-chain fatty acid-CoA ligase faa2 [Kickxella alabastrina]|uniref:Medium-chain fatty acid-CoA ligase faa2 n=1 Tax=Kickxella alabastrina TaxID=61397 RepID=A0ACC1I8D5_9FUNG|nr:medium-chain fatty acid-CoA ligase faa2 [Kickxella alabastrina]
MSFADPTVVVCAVLAAIAGTVYFYYYSLLANQPDIHPLQLAQQSSVSKTRQSLRETATYRSKSTPDGTRLLSTLSDDMKTLRDAIRLGRSVASPSSVQTIVDDAVQKVTSEEMVTRVSALSAGLLRLLGEAQIKSAAIYLEGSVEALVAYQACIEAGIVAIPISASESPASVSAILKHSKTRLLVTLGALAVKLGAAAVASTCIKHVVLVGELDGSEASDAFRTAASVTHFRELERGSGCEKDAVIEPADAAYVLYGSVGEGRAPRGVVITHANALAAITGIIASLPATQVLTKEDTFMSVASLANAINLNFINIALTYSCSICILETTDAEKFINQAYQLQPTFTFLDPLITRDLVQLFYSNVVKYPKLEYAMFMSGYRRAQDSLMRGIVPKFNFWDFSYFRHYRNVMGGKLRLMYIDGPTTPSKNIEWLRVMHGAKVIPLFGTAHTTALITAGSYYDYASAIDTHNVGAPVACNEIKLVDAVDGVSLTAEDKPYSRGRIFVRGANVAVGLWNDKPLELRPGNWLELPYYGEIFPNGTIDVIGSTQGTTKSSLSPSGYLLAERLELALASSRAITDICIVSSPDSKTLDIVAHPRPMELFAEAQLCKRTYRMKDIEKFAWCAEYIRDKIIETARKSSEFRWVADLPVQSVRVRLVSAPFSVENNLALQDGTNNRAAAKKLFSSL